MTLSIRNVDLLRLVAKQDLSTLQALANGVGNISEDAENKIQDESLRNAIDTTRLLMQEDSYIGDPAIHYTDAGHTNDTLVGANIARADLDRNGNIEVEELLLFPLEQQLKYMELFFKHADYSLYSSTDFEADLKEIYKQGYTNPLQRFEGTFSFEGKWKDELLKEDVATWFFLQKKGLSYKPQQYDIKEVRNTENEDITYPNTKATLALDSVLGALHDHGKQNRVFSIEYVKDSPFYEEGLAFVAIDAGGKVMGFETSQGE